MNGSFVDNCNASGIPLRSADELPSAALLDYLLSLACSFYLLLLVPLAAGAIAYLSAPYLPRIYESESTISLAASDMRTADALLRTPTVLDPIVDRHVPRGRSATRRRAAVDSRFQFFLAKGAEPTTGNMYRLVTTGPAPTAAQALNRDLLEAWFAASQPRSGERERLRGQIARAEESLIHQTTLIGRLEKELASLVVPGMMQEFMSILDDLQARRERTIQLIHSLKRQLAVGDRDRLVSEPTLAVEPVWPARTALAAAAAVATGLLLLAIVTLRHFWRRAMADPVLATRLREIGHALVPFRRC